MMNAAVTVHPYQAVIECAYPQSSGGVLGEIPYTLCCPDEFRIVAYGPGFLSVPDEHPVSVSSEVQVSVVIQERSEYALVAPGQYAMHRTVLFHSHQAFTVVSYEDVSGRILHYCADRLGYIVP